MNQALSDDLLSRFQRLLADQMGLHFGPERWPDLRRGLEAASRDFGYRDAGDCLAWLAAAPFSHRQIEVLANHLTIGETYFFRDRRSWEILETEVLPDLVRSRRLRDRRLRLWSAGCATGEEAYSLAILLTRTIADWRDWAITLLATDVNASSLARALDGVYGEWSFRDAPPWLKDGYFRQVENSRYRLESWVRQLVTFAPLNLAGDHYPSLLNNTNAMDLIVCRNVVMYFSPSQAQRVLSQMQQCLVAGGWLVGTATESAYLAAIGLTPVRFPGGVLYRKDDAKAVAVSARVPLAERNGTGVSAAVAVVGAAGGFMRERPLDRHCRGPRTGGGSPAARPLRPGGGRLAEIARGGPGQRRRARFVDAGVCGSREVDGSPWLERKGGRCGQVESSPALSCTPRFCRSWGLTTRPSPA